MIFARWGYGARPLREWHIHLAQKRSVVRTEPRFGVTQSGAHGSTLSWCPASVMMVGMIRLPVQHQTDPPISVRQAKDPPARSWSDGKNYTTIANALQIDRAETVHLSWEQLDGIIMDLVTAYETLGKELRPLFWAAWSADYPDPDSLLRGLFLLPYHRWHHEVYDRLVEEARRLTDQEVRMELYRQADRTLAEEVPIASVMSLRQHLLVKPWVRTYPMSLMGNVFWKDVVIEPH